MTAPRPAVAACALAVALLVGAGGTGVAIADVRRAAPAPCRAVTLFSVGGHPAGATDTLSAVTDPLVQAVGDRLAVVTVPPPAVGTDDAAAEQAAVSALAGSVTAQLATCPTGAAMLFGHSEGAHVAGDVASRVGAGQEPGIAPGRILAVGLFGDPARGADTRVVPESTAGQGVLPPRAGGFGALDARTIQICAPDDPVCATDPSAAAPTLAQALAAPAHAGYAQLLVAQGTPATAWASDSVARLIASLPAGGVDATTPAAAGGGRGRDGNDDAEPDAGEDTTDAGSDADTGETDTGALWAMTSGLEGFRSSDGGNVEGGGLAPEVVPSPNVPGRSVVELEVPAGGKRSEVRPEEAQDIRAGEHLFFGYSAFLPADFPADTRSWQVIWQLHDGGTNTSPPMALEIVEGKLWLANVGDRVRDLGPVAAGRNLDVQLDITFAEGGGEVTVYRGGRPVLENFRPPRGTMIDSFDFLKTGVYRDPDGGGGDATLFLNDLKIGETLASVSDLAGASTAPDPAPRRSGVCRGCAEGPGRASDRGP